MAKPTRRTTRQPTPWGRVAGLLTACFVTLTGVTLQLDPNVILLRAAAGAFVVGVTVAITAAVARSGPARQRVRRH